LAVPNRETVSFKSSIILGCRVHQEVGIKQTTEISDAPLSRKFAKLRAMTTSSPETNTLTQAIKRVLPKTLFGRALAIIVTPLILMQAISTFVFYDRHWDVMTRRLVYSLSGDIALVVEQLGQMPDAETLVNATRGARRHLDMVLVFRPDAILENTAQHEAVDQVGESLRRSIAAKLQRPFVVDTETVPKRIEVRIQFANGVLDASINRKRLYSSTSYVFVMWMVGSSLVLFAIAIIFMRNQIRPIRRLAIAARGFGLGRDTGDLKPEGASEVRLAGEAFRQMRDRIRRQITQRTEMLAGVSHDLRTPLTRMKLQLAMLEESDGIDELRGDVSDMERMVEGYLAFARGEGTEAPVESDVVELVTDAVQQHRRAGMDVSMEQPPSNVPPIPVRPQAIQRAVTNLLGNAARYAEHVEVTLLHDSEHLEIIVDDDGPGIPEDNREEVFRPFHRLDASRNPDTGGVGLGLTIARDIVRGHGGDLLLEDSPKGGLRGRISLPV
jgi:two-component system, OmpR family, osmolarity sensor histidine kinase EnvZ